MQADMLWGELWYQHAAADMGSGPQGCYRGAGGPSESHLRIKKYTRVSIEGRGGQRNDKLKCSQTGSDRSATD